MEQQAGFAFNALFLNPVSRTEATDENGSIIRGKIMSVQEEGVESPTMYGIAFFIDTDMTEKKVRSAVYRGGTSDEAAVVALTSNIGNQIAEYEAVKNGEVYIASFTGKGEDSAAIERLAAEFTAKGFTVVEDSDEADIAYLSVVPTCNGSQGSNIAMGVLDLVEDMEVRELKRRFPAVPMPTAIPMATTIVPGSA